jgi:hypothetical protein
VGSIFSFKGEVLLKWPERLPYPVFRFIRAADQRPDDPHQIRQAVLQLGPPPKIAQSTKMTVTLLIRRCKDKRLPKINDSLGTELTGADAARSLILWRPARVLR